MTTQTKKRPQEAEQDWNTNLPAMGKLPPQAIDLEKSLLGQIMLIPDAFEAANQFLIPDCFYRHQHGIIYQAMISLNRKHTQIDMLTVVTELKAMDKLQEVGGAFYITQLTNEVSGQVEYNARIIFQKYHLRRLIEISMQTITLAYDPTSDNFDVQENLEKELSGIGNFISGDMVGIDEVAYDAYKQIEKWKSEDNKGITGVDTGTERLNNITRGWQPADLIIIAARPSCGKTAFALNIAKRAAEYGNTVAVWSLEMKAMYLNLRMISTQSEVDLHNIQSGSITDKDLAKIQNSVSRLSKLPIFFDDSTNVTLSSITRKARKMKRKNDLKLIIVDYLQLMTADEKKNRNREGEVSSISRDLKKLAKELDVPIIALSQLSREGVKNTGWEYGPPISALRESGAIEQDADLVCMLWKPTDEEIGKDPLLLQEFYDESGNKMITERRRLRVAKQRNGRLGTIEFDFESSIQKFSEHQETMDFIPTSTINEPF